MARLLLIDDDQAVLDVLRRYLESDGHEVLQATGGTVALELLDQQPDPVDLVITDVYMPEIDGIEFIIRLTRCMSPDKVIAFSGGGYRSSKDVLTIAQDLGVALTLHKPFSRRQLLDAVLQVVGS